MRAFGSSPEKLGGRLLLAHPHLRDPNFRRSIIVLATHDEKDGAMGWVVNHPLGKTVQDFPLAPDVRDGLESVPVSLGGPVQRDQLMFVSFRWQDERFVCRTHLEAAEARALLHDPLESVRAFIGCAGWSAGQLETELQQKAWIVQPALHDLWENLRTTDLWRETMRQLGPLYRLLADAPDDPSLN